MTDKPIKPISDLVGRVVAIRPAGSAVVPHKPVPPGGHPEPVLPPDLQAQVDVVGGGSLFGGDFRMVREASFHPDAARFADEQRRALLPAPEKAIRAWYHLLTQGVPASAGSEGFVEGVLLMCGDYPAACWTRDTARAVLRAINPDRPFWPSAPQVDAVLRQIAERMRGRASRLDQIARADPATAGQFRGGPARESTVAYPVQSVPENIGRPPPRRVLPDPEKPDFLVKAPKDTVDEEAEKAQAALDAVLARRGGGGKP